MATLKYYANLNEGTGTTVADSVSSNTGTVIVVSGSPAWVTGYNGGYALDFNGEAFAQDTSPRVWAEDTNICGHDSWGDGLTFAATFKLNTWTPRAIFSLTLWNSGDSNDPYFYSGLYLGSDGKVYFGELLTTGSRYPVSVNSNSALAGATWYRVLGRRTNKLFELWVDGVKQTETANPAAGVVMDDALDGCRLMIGMSRLNNAGSSIWFDGANSSDTSGAGTFDGIIDECYFWCGALTDDEVDDFFNPPVLRSSILFGCNT